MEIESVFKLAVEDYGFKLLINLMEEKLQNLFDKLKILIKLNTKLSLEGRTKK